MTSVHGRLRRCAGLKLLVPAAQYLELEEKAMRISLCVVAIALVVFDTGGCGSASNSANPAVAKCQNLQTLVCTRAVDCAIEAGTSPQSERATQYNSCLNDTGATLKCDKATGVSPSFDQCITDISGATCDMVNAALAAGTLPRSCSGAILE